MNIRVGCSFTVSKKLEGLLEQGEPIHILIEAVHGNKGMGHIIMSTKRLPAPAEIGNTSLMLDAVSVDESVPDFTDGTKVSNFFAGGQDVENEPPSSPVRRFAKVNPVEESKAFVSLWGESTAKEGPRRASHPAPQQDSRPTGRAAPEVVQEPPEAVPEDSPSIMSYEELLEEIAALGDLDFESAVAAAGGQSRVSRADAVKLEKKGKMAPKLKKPAYVRNIRGGHIEIADMDEKIGNKEVFDLGIVPARKLRDSRDLKWCLDNRFLEFCSRREYLYWLENRDADADLHEHGLKTYGGREEAAGNMFEGLPDPMVEEYSRAPERPKRELNAHERIRNAGRQAVVRDNRDIIDTDEECSGDDNDDIATRNLVSSMDPGGVKPEGAPRSIPSRGRDRQQTAGGAKVKSIRKV